MERLKIALIGAGQIARTTHIPNLKKIPETEITGICDTRIEAAQQTAREGGIQHYYGSHVEMIEKERPDAVIICVPNQCHCEMTMSALDMGCHVLCEKPPAMTAEQAEQMEKKAKEKGKLYLMVFICAPAKKYRSFGGRSSKEQWARSIMQRPDGAEGGGFRAGEILRIKRFRAEAPLSTLALMCWTVRCISWGTRRYLECTLRPAVTSVETVARG